MPYFGHQGCIYWDEEHVDLDTLEKREKEMQEQRLETENFRRKKMLQLAFAPFLERNRWGYLWWREDGKHIASAMCAFLFRVEHNPGNTVLTMRNPKSEMPFEHLKKTPSPGKGKKYYRSSCDKKCAHCNGSLPGCGGCKDPDCAKCILSKAKAAAKATAQADKDAEAKAED